MAARISELSPGELKAWLDDAVRADPLLLDVREPWEVDICRIEGSKSLPMGELISRWPDLDPEQPTVVICHHGVRSFQVAHFLARSGFTSAINLRGGVAAWADEVEPSMARY
jgi:rhodanese-related sulfurtransferase